MVIEAVYRRPHTSKPADGHKVSPYLLHGLVIERVNQVWTMDITYIPMAHGFVCLAAVMDWFSRRVLTARVSITMAPDRWAESWRLTGDNRDIQRSHIAGRTAPTG
jgi:putative transposase